MDNGYIRSSLNLKPLRMAYRKNLEIKVEHDSELLRRQWWGGEYTRA